MNSYFINMKTDYGFKKIFEDMDLLRDFLNDMLCGERTVASVEPRNPEWMPLSPEDRKIIVDVYCTSDDGTHFIVEMQYARQAYFPDRALFYDAFCLTRQGEKGSDWKYGIMPVVSIYLLNFVLDPDTADDEVYRTDVGLTDLRTGRIFNPKIREIFIEFPKFRKRFEECENDYERWIYFIKNMNMIDIDAPYFPFPKDSKFAKLLQMGRLSNYTSEELDQYYYALKVYRDNRNVYEYMMESEERGLERGMKKGMEKGLEKGIAQGLEKGKIETARNLKQLGVSTEIIMQATGLSEEEIQQL